MEELTGFCNNTRLWVTKGYTPEELRPTSVPVVKEDKIGRNDPSPCGDGKKYKKCRGRGK